MDLLPFLALSALGVSAIAALVWRLDRKPPTVLADDAAARARFERDFPRAAVTALSRASDGASALLELGPDDAIGLVTRCGRRFATRRIAAGRLRSVARDGNALALELDDFTMPQVTLRLDAAALDRWEPRLRALLPAAEAAA